MTFARAALENDVYFRAGLSSLEESPLVLGFRGEFQRETFCSIRGGQTQVLRLRREQRTLPASLRMTSSGGCWQSRSRFRVQVLGSGFGFRFWVPAQDPDPG